jgi:hypothetical protein
VAEQHELVHGLAGFWMRECRARPGGVKGPEFYNSRFSPQRLKAPVKFFIDNWVLFLAAITSGGLLLWPMIERGGGAGRITPARPCR